MAIQSISTTYGFKWFGTRYLQDQPFFTNSDQQLTFLDSSVMDMHFAALRACYGLQHLEFVFHYDVYEHYYHKKVTKKNVHPDLVVAVQGLRTLKIKVSDYKSAFTNRDHYDTLVLNTQTCRESLAHVLGKAALVEKAKVYQPSKFFSRVIDWASLDIDGDGRLSEDRKPGVVASRTRQATKNLSTMDAFGVIPKDACPKYSIDGELSWGESCSYIRKFFSHKAMFKAISRRVEERTVLARETCVFNILIQLQISILLATLAHQMTFCTQLSSCAPCDTVMQTTNICGLSLTKARHGKTLVYSGKY